MKTLMCSYCDYKSSGMTEKEIMDDMWDHIKEAHPKEYDKGMKMSEADQDKMKDETKKMIKDE